MDANDDKIVKHCHTHGALRRSQCNLGGKHTSGNQAYRCKQCLSVSHKKHYETHKKEVRRKADEYKKNNYEKVLAIKRKSYRKTAINYWVSTRNPSWRDSRYTDSTYELDHEGRLALEDWYVRELIAKQHGMKIKEIPQGMVDLKREILKVKRLIREIRTGEKTNGEEKK